MAYRCSGSSDCQELGGAQFMLHALNRLSQINRETFHGSPAKGVIRASQISGQSRQSQNETGLAPGAAWGGGHIWIFFGPSLLSNRGISVAPYNSRYFFYPISPPSRSRSTYIWDDIQSTPMSCSRHWLTSSVSAYIYGYVAASVTRSPLPSGGRL